MALGPRDTKGARLLESDVPVRHEKQVRVARCPQEARGVLVEAPQAVHRLRAPREREVSHGLPHATTGMIG